MMHKVSNDQLPYRSKGRPFTRSQLPNYALKNSFGIDRQNLEFSIKRLYYPFANIWREILLSIGANLQQEIDHFDN